MKYVLYIDYRNNPAKPRGGYEYRPMNAETMAQAVAEADSILNVETMYMIKIMEKSGKEISVERGLRMQKFTAVLEKRRVNWCIPENEHNAGCFVSKYGSWIEII